MYTVNLLSRWRHGDFHGRGTTKLQRSEHLPFPRRTEPWKLLGYIASMKACSSVSSEQHTNTWKEQEIGFYSVWSRKQEHNGEWQTVTPGERKKNSCKLCSTVGVQTLVLNWGSPGSSSCFIS